MVNITKLQDIEPYELNQTLLQNENLIETAVETTQNTLGDLFGFSILVFVYLYVLATLVFEGGKFRLDILQAHIIASGMCVVFATLLLLIGLSSNIYTLSLFVVLFFIGIIAMMLSRK